DSGDVGMGKRGEDLPLAQETRGEGWIRRAVSQELDSDALFQFTIGAFGEIDGAHAASPQKTHQAVRSAATAGGERIEKLGRGLFDYAGQVVGRFGVV